MRERVVQQLIVFCKGCKRNVAVELLTRVPIQESIEAMKKLKCPECGMGSEGLMI